MHGNTPIFFCHAQSRSPFSFLIYEKLLIFLSPASPVKPTLKIGLVILLLTTPPEPSGGGHHQPVPDPCGGLLIALLASPLPSGAVSEQQPELSIGNIHHVTLQPSGLPSTLKTPPTLSLLMPARSCPICPLPPHLLVPYLVSPPSLCCSHMGSLFLPGLARLLSTSGLLHVLFPLSRTFFHHFPSLIGSLLKCHLSERHSLTTLSPSTF